MKIEVLNTIKRKGDKWEFSAKFYHNKIWVPVIGTVSDMKTEAQTKRAIKKKVNAKAAQYIDKLRIPQEKVLSADSVFKEIL